MTFDKLTSVQGIVSAYNPATRDGIILTEATMDEVNLSPEALVGSVFRMLRPGQRVIFDLDDSGLAINLRLGSEVDMATPDQI